MKKIFLFISLAAIAVTGWFFLSAKDDIIYFSAGLFGGPFGEKGDKKPLLFYGKDLPKIFQDYHLKCKTPKSWKKCTHAKKIIVFDLLSDVPLQILSQYPKEKLSLFLWEPPTVLPNDYDKKNHVFFSKIYTWCDDLVDNKKYFKFYYPEVKGMEKNTIPFAQKKLCTLICRNKNSQNLNELYSERQNVVSFFEKTAPNDFDLYGQGWEEKHFSTYKGSPSTKECLKNYKFCFAYENIHKINGYITEKIFDCFQYGCVPIYWGAENVTTYIPANCFIDRRKFSSNEELYLFLKNMSEDEHNAYIENIRLFLDSDKAKLFSIDHFLETFKEAAGIEKQPL